MKTIILITLFSFNVLAYDIEQCQTLRSHYKATLNELNLNPDLSAGEFLKGKASKQIVDQFKDGNPNLALKIYAATRDYAKGKNIGLRRKNISQADFLNEVELHCLQYQ